MTCASCNRPGVLGFDLFTYFFGWHKGEPVHRNAHRECVDELRRKWREWRGWV